MKIKVFEKTPGCFPVEYEVGDWYDLRTSEEITIRGPFAKTLHKKKGEETTERTRDVIFTSKRIPLGICMEIPKGYEALLVPRSSAFKKYGLIQTNAPGIIDNSFSSEDDEWKFSVMATRTVTIPKKERIAQFRIQLSQKATIWQKIKWLFKKKPKFKLVLSLNNPTRGGFGEGTDKSN